MKKSLYSIFILFAFTMGKAQVGINTDTPHASSVLEVLSTEKGVLLPRLALTSTTIAAPVSAPADYLTVMNTATAGDVTPGYYYWLTNK